MKITPIVAHLQATCPSFAGRISAGIDWAAVALGDQLAQPIITPSTIRGELIAQYARLEEEGHVENAETFAQHLIVERDGNDPSRVNVMFPPDYINGLRVFALLNQFRLDRKSVV